MLKEAYLCLKKFIHDVTNETIAKLEKTTSSSMSRGNKKRKNMNQKWLETENKCTETRVKQSIMKQNNY